MTKTQRLILVTAALAVAVRVFLPIQYVVSGGERFLISYWPGVRTQAFPTMYPVTDVYTTVLQALGIVTVAAALYVVAPLIPTVAPRIRISRRAKIVALISLFAVAVGFGGWNWTAEWNYWTAHHSTKPEAQHSVPTPVRPILTNPQAVVEGQSIGVVAVGMTLDGVRHKIGKPLSSAFKDRTGMTAYWDTERGRWIVHFDGTALKATSIGFVARKTQAIPFETTKGARYGQSAETIRALYGEPAKSYEELDVGAFLNPPQSEYPKSYYYPGIEFSFWCVISSPHTKKDCIDEFYTLYRVTVYAKGFQPDWAR